MNGNTDAASSSSSAARTSVDLSGFVIGLMYETEFGLMCRPCSQQELFEGLSKGFLPAELPVYPLMNGTVLNPVPLKFFKQYPRHPDTGFTYVGSSNFNMSSTTNIHLAPAQDIVTDTNLVLSTYDQQSHVHQAVPSSDVSTDLTLGPGPTVVQWPQQHFSGEERCWLFLDSHGRSIGPHSLLELDNWHQHGYLNSSVMIRHIDNSCGPFTLLPLINAWRKGNTTINVSENVAIGTSEDLKSWGKKCQSHISTDGAAASKKNGTGFRKTADMKSKVREIEAPSDELGVPPGSNPVVLKSSLTPHYFRKENLSNLNTQHHDEDGEGTIARVEEELHISRKRSMADFPKTTLEKEVLKRTKPLKDNETNEVSAENLVRLCNANDNRHASSIRLEGPRSGNLRIYESQACQKRNRSSDHPGVFPQKHSSDYLGNGFRRLGAPARIASNRFLTGKRLPQSLINLGIDRCSENLCKWYLNQVKNATTGIRYRRAQAAVSSNFRGSVSKKLKLRVNRVVDDQRTNNPLFPGSGSEIGDVESSSISKFQPAGLGEGISNFRGSVSKKLKMRVNRVVDDQRTNNPLFPGSGSEIGDAESSSISKFQPAGLGEGFSKHKKFMVLALFRQKLHDDVLREWLCSFHDDMNPFLEQHALVQPELKKSGSSEVDFTYSRRNNVLKKSGAEPSYPPQHIKLCQQSSKKFEKPKNSKIVSHSGTLSVENIKQKAEAMCQKESRLYTVTSKVRATKRNLAKGCQSIRSSSGLKIQNDVGPAQTSTMSYQKRKNLVDGSPSLPPKAPKLMDADAKLSKFRVMSSCPVSVGCARTSIDGWEWREWSLNARPAEKARIRGCQITSMQRFSGSELSHVRGISARTNRVKMRNLLAAAEGIELLKTSQIMARKKCLQLERSKIHGWGVIALEAIETDDFVTEYVGELIRAPISDIREHQYEKIGMGVGSSYLFKLDNNHVVDATKRGGIARFINHSCEPNCYTKIVTVEGQKRIFIYAKRRVSAGEEITYNYKFPLEEKKIPCNCGSKRCRGSMN